MNDHNCPECGSDAERVGIDRQINSQTETWQCLSCRAVYTVTFEDPSIEVTDSGGASD